MDRRNLKVFRVSKGLSQQEMADVLGVSRSTYGDAERGKRLCSQRLLDKLQKTFDLSDADVWQMTKTESNVFKKEKGA